MYFPVAYSLRRVLPGKSGVEARGLFERQRPVYVTALFSTTTTTVNGASHSFAIACGVSVVAVEAAPRPEETEETVLKLVEREASPNPPDTS